MNERLENVLQNFHNLQLEIKNLQEQAEEVKMAVSEILIEDDLTEYESSKGVTVKKFTPKPANRLNKGLVENYCSENKLDLQMFYKTGNSKEQVKIMIPETRKIIAKFLNSKE